MKISAQNITFKGYDAAPLKRIYIEQEYSKPFEDELKAAAKTENIIKNIYPYND